MRRAVRIPLCGPPYAIRGKEDRPFAPVRPDPRVARLGLTGPYRPDVLGRTTAGITPVVRLAGQAGVPAFSAARTTPVLYSDTSFIA